MTENNNIPIIPNMSLDEQRLIICKRCPSLSAMLFICKECGCFMKVKTKIPTAKCPLGKW
jgi:hypothetical protein